MKKPVDRAPETVALHADRQFEKNSGIAPAIMQSVTYFADDADDFAVKAEEPLNDKFYARHGNETSSRVAQVIAELEGAESGMMFASGMGAITTAVLAHVACGDHVVGQTNHYIGTTKLLSHTLAKFGIDVTLVDQRSTRAFAEAVTAETKLIIVESPVNPTMAMTDLRAVSDIARGAGAKTLCDNTFATPINQRPLDFGIDMVAHSATKYIGGHHDLLAGCIAGANADLERIWDMSMTLGALSAPMNSWLALRGIRTLSLRVRQQNETALCLANYLTAHPAVERVHYPFLDDHPQFALAKRQMKAGGGLLSFTLKGGYEAGVRFLKAVEIIQNAGSLGGIDSVAIQPAVMWGGRLPEEKVREQGIEPGMIRLATGIENTDDLIADIEQALENA